MPFIAFRHVNRTDALPGNDLWVHHPHLLNSLQGQCGTKAVVRCSVVELFTLSRVDGLALNAVEGLVLVPPFFAAWRLGERQCRFCSKRFGESVDCRARAE